MKLNGTIEISNFNQVAIEHTLWNKNPYGWWTPEDNTGKYAHNIPHNKMVNKIKQYQGSRKYKVWISGYTINITRKPRKATVIRNKPVLVPRRVFKRLMYVIGNLWVGKK